MEVLYYENISTEAVFISIDEGETLINPAGKVIPNNGKLFEEVDESDAGELTTAQKSLLDFEERAEENRTQPTVSDFYTSYHGCEMTHEEKAELVEGKRVLITITRGRFIWIKREEGKDPQPAIEEKLQQVMRSRRTRRHIVIGVRGGLTLLNPRGRAKKVYGDKALYWTTD